MKPKKTTIQKSLKGTIILLLLEKKHLMEEINGLGEGLTPSLEELLKGFSSLDKEGRGEPGSCLTI